MKNTRSFLKMKDSHEPITMITAYDYPSARFVEQAGADCLLVGDSVGMVVLGYESTVHVTLEDMIHHTKAVKRGAIDTFVITDMPFMTYHGSVETTLTNARRLMQDAGAHALKLEGAGDVLTKITALSHAGVPVVGHLGLTPQSVGVLGGYRIQGKDAESAQQLLKDAKAIEEAGAFMLVLECVPKELAKEVTEALTIPVIGIGAGVAVDGQVLVYHDVIGYGVDRVPSFVKQYDHIGPTIDRALSAYIDDVKQRQFPNDQCSFTMKGTELKAFYGGQANESD